MPEVHYEIVEHDGGWAYKLGDVYSETYLTKAAARAAAQSAAARQGLPGSTSDIEYQDAEGQWHAELARGQDRPQADVRG